MDNDFYISSLLYKLKTGEMTTDEMCQLFPENNRQKLKVILEEISFPVTFKYLRKITVLF